MNTLAKKDDKRYEYFIYKLYNPDCDYVYVGSTRDFTTRKSKHKSDCNNVNSEKYNFKVYKTIRDNDGFENWHMVILEIMPDVTKLEAEMQEDCYRVDLNATMNSQRATRGLMTLQEYHKQHNKQYYQDNKETIQQYKKQHYQDNREQLKEQSKQYRIDNKEQVNEKAKQKCYCDCGGRYTYSCKGRHLQTKKHKSYLLSLAI
jgi:hypothetical protein